MFRWQKELRRLDIPEARVLRLQVSLGPVQVALPGLPAHEATAYLCAFSAGKGVRVAVVFGLHSSGRLAFYLNEEGEVRAERVGKVFEGGIHFAESMGFVLSDTDIHRLEAAARKALWESLPLQGGLLPSSGEAGGEEDAAGAAQRLRQIRENLGRFLSSF